MANLHTSAIGTGEPAVFVHGSFGWGTETFARQTDLADEYQIHVVDRRGFGLSPAAAVIGWPTDMHDIADLLTTVGPAHLVGQSYGGVVTLLAAGLRPDLVRSLVVIEPPLLGAVPDDPVAAPMADSLRSLAERVGALDTVAYVSQWAAAVMKRSGTEVDAWTSSWGEQDWAAAESSRLECTPVDAPVDFGVLASLSVPKVVAVGGWPTTATTGHPAGLAFRSIANSIADRIGATLVVFAESTHNPQLEQPDEFNAMLRRTWTRTVAPVTRKCDHLL